MGNEKTAREQLADLCHDQWSGWLKHQFSKMEVINGSVVLPAGSITRWARQMCVSYDNLTEPEKDADRREADRFISLFMEVVRVSTSEVLSAQEKKEFDNEAESYGKKRYKAGAKALCDVVMANLQEGKVLNEQTKS